MGRRAFRQSVLLGIVLLVLGAAAAWLLTNGTDSLRWLRSESSLERGLSEELPVGTRIENVEAYLYRKGYKITSMSTLKGISTRKKSLLGDQHIRAHMGGFSYGLGREEVEARFAFDKHGELVGLEVRKLTRAP